MTRSFWLALVFLLAATVHAEPPQRVQFTRLIDHLVGYDDPGYLKFIEDVKPEVVQVGWYGAHMYGPSPYETWDHGKFSRQTLRERGQYFENLNRELHRRGVKVVGHFNVEFLVGDPDSPDGPRGFFKFFRDLWDERELGPRPADNLLELLERGPDGKPIVHNQYVIGGMKEYWACLNNPRWRAVLKAWVKAGVRRGATHFGEDPFVKNAEFPFRSGLLCITFARKETVATFSQRTLNIMADSQPDIKLLQDVPSSIDAAGQRGWLMADEAIRHLESLGILPTEKKRGQKPVVVSPAILMELSAIVRLNAWQDAGLCDALPEEMDSAFSAAIESEAKMTADPNSLVMNDDLPPLTKKLLDIWQKHFAWRGLEDLGADVLVDSAQLSDEHFLENLADLLWEHCGAGKPQNLTPPGDQQKCNDP